jgi:hypothetical protein
VGATGMVSNGFGRPRRRLLLRGYRGSWGGRRLLLGRWPGRRLLLTENRENPECADTGRDNDQADAPEEFHECIPFTLR